MNKKTGNIETALPTIRSVAAERDSESSSRMPLYRSDEGLGRWIPLLVILVLLSAAVIFILARR